MKKLIAFTIQGRHLSLNKHTKFKIDDFTIEISHRENEPENVLRIQVILDNLKVELLPSKGLSIGEVFIRDTPIFWEPPTDLIDPDKLNLISHEILVNHHKIDGFTFMHTMYLLIFNCN